MNLTEFLLARLEDDEALWVMARDADMAFTARGAAPAVPPHRFAERMLADVEAKRNVVDMARRSFMPHPVEIGANMSPTQTMAWLNLTYLAQPYADQPDFDEAWRV